jgi:LPS sulfotransferase NodH
MKPKLSYTIWFSQRTGSTLLCKALEATGLAGNPQEWLYVWLTDQQWEHPAELQLRLWEGGSTANGVFGLKHSFHEPAFRRLIDLFQMFPGSLQHESNRARVWELALPNHRHIFMTRRNKVRLAVSWWRAIQTQEWHRLAGVPRTTSASSEGYNFEAIHHLYRECSMREAGIQEFFSEGNIVPLTIVYEDFVQEYEKTVRKVLEFLELDTMSLSIPAPSLAPTADPVSEEWAQRFREECQGGWEHRGW